jgi:hypothetical protein
VVGDAIGKICGGGSVVGDAIGKICGALNTVHARVICQSGWDI